MTRLSDPMSSEYDEGPATPSGQQVRRTLDGKFVCPFCGSVNAQSDEACVKCGMENTPATRNSTRARIGPWYVLQKRNPSAPGMKFETLLRFVGKGRVQARTIVRGPTTSQLWRFAATVKGLSREFGLCYNCGGDVDKTAALCPHCGRNQQPPADPDVLLETKTAPTPHSQRDVEMFADQVIGDDADTAETQEPVRSTPVPQARAKSAPTHGGPYPFNAANNATVVPTSRAVPPPPVPSSAKPTPQPMPESPLTAQMRRDAQERKEIEAGRRQRETERRDPNKHTPTLNAAELATAFQLDFTPSAMGRVRHRKSHKKIYVLLTLLLIAGGAVAAYYKVPAFGQQVDTTYADVWTTVKEWTAAKPIDPQTQKQVDAITAQGPKVPPKPQVVPSSPPETPRVVEPKIVETPRVVESPRIVEQPRAVEVPTIVTPAPPKPALSLEESYVRSKKLWGDALSSEAQGDWAAAVRAYEEIKTLNARAWPGGLDMRLNAAKQQAGQ